MTTYAEDLEKLRELLSAFDNCMLVTADKSGVPRARPMHLAEVQANGTLLFATSVATDVAADVRREPRALCTFQSSALYISVDGIALLTTRRERIQSAWRESWRAAFPLGPEDPTIALLEIEPHEVEYWDTTGGNGVRMLIEVVRAAIQGVKVENPAPTHDRLHL